MNNLLSSPLPRFVLGVLILMPLSLAFWWFLGKEYLIPILEKGVLITTKWLMANHVIGLASHGNIWMVKTSLSPLNNPLTLLAIPIFPTRMTVSFPLLWGLVLATPGAGRVKQIVAGTVILFPVVLLMLLLYIQFRLALHINHRPILTEVPTGSYVLALPYPDYLYQLMAMGRQFALLVLPTLAPLMIWGLLNQAFIRSVIFQGIFSRLIKQSMSAPNGHQGS